MGIGGSVFLIAAGAILAWAITVNDATVGSVTVDWGVVGYILMAAGVLGLIWSIVLMNKAEQASKSAQQPPPQNYDSTNPPR